jgi:uncharacterized protein with ACT and thioredoxin-like domain
MNRYKVKVKNSLGEEAVTDIELEKIEDIESVAILRGEGLTCQEASELKKALKKVMKKDVLIINSSYKVEFLEIEKV